MTRRWIVGTAIAATAVAAVALTAAVAQAAEARDYVVLGDSYASGLGAGSYRDQTCLQSDGYSYPARWVAKKGRAAFGDSIVNRSCSGATVTTVSTKQLGNLDAETGWVTITVGGNDIGFTSTLTTCVLGTDANCATAVQAGLGKATTSLPGALDRLFATIRSKAPNAKVYVVGYPRLVTTSATPVGNCMLSTYERQQLNHSADVLAEVIRQRTAAKSGFTFVDGRSIFSGHEACTAAPWINRPGTGSLNEAFHPNRTGYEQYANRLQQITG
ncbi:SGNH/GDSL hydrolase family protein [Actinoplanes sp. ATCC 53533]|uniref:SGNH/GDSL hydrolase family protein n=1 Tax=Actinoplanes sp. ATCC 53533 TaxID=1288362 RepID=UPI0013155A0D|nr:SGNH/GDSL hydrolase family protein [Actinoplanes sp. ATCC 53533]